MNKFKPWGSLGWILPKMKVADWHVVVSSSFEDRATALIEWMQINGCNIRSSALFRFVNPPSDNWAEAAGKVEVSFQHLSNALRATEFFSCEIPLLDSPRASALAAVDSSKSTSVILDISTFPKRFFLYVFRELMRDKRIDNVLVTYSRAASYPEFSLCENSLPPSPLPGYSRIEPNVGKSKFVIGVGYMALSVETLLEEAKSSTLDFIFPFPPASPAYRRNWALLYKLMPEDVPSHTRIHKVDSMDAFELCSRLIILGAEADLNMVPLGPKPHALGMAMAHLHLHGRSEIIYAQPMSYLPNYSVGIARGFDGQPEIMGYCVKWKGQATF